MININDIPLRELTANELEQTNGGGGGWGEFIFRLAISEFDDIARGMRDALSGSGYHYK